MKLWMMFALVSVAVSGLTAAEWFEPATGRTWQYLELPDGTVSVGSEKIEKIALSPEPWGTLRIPSVIAGKKVTGVTDLAFRKCLRLKEIVVPPTVVNIYPYAFAACKNVKTLTLPVGLDGIGKEAFMGMAPTKLTAARLPDSRLNPEYIEELVVPEGVTELKRCAFMGCLRLKKLSLPSTLKTIGPNAFWGCKALEELNLPANLETIGEGAFQGCESLTSLTLPAKVKKLGFGAFWGCSGLERVQCLGRRPEIEGSAFDHDEILDERTSGDK